jgi:hypothetical protein
VDAPQLECLVIEAKNIEPPFILSDSHLHAPSLRRLELENCGVDWKSGFLGRLTHLELERLPADSLLEFNDFIKFLTNMPLLEDVCLNYDYVRSEDTGVIPSPDNIPTCPYWRHLQRLEILDESATLHVSSITSSSFPCPSCI